MSKGRTGVPNRMSMLAHKDMERIGLNPIEELKRCMDELKELKEEALAAYKTMRGYGSDGKDSGTAYLASAIKAVSDQAVIANNLAKYKHPTLSAVAVKDLTDSTSNKEPMTTAQAIDVLKMDAFAPKELKELPTEKIIDAMESTIKTPFLPSGNLNAKPD